MQAHAHACTLMKTHIYTHGSEREIEIVTESNRDRETEIESEIESQRKTDREGRS